VPASPVLLVHGAWHGAWCWDRVVPLLVGEGIEVHTIDLPGHGASTAPLGDLHDDAAAVAERLEAIGQADVVLVGHSYGGAVITEAGVHDSVGRLVYVAAFALDRGESCNRAGADDPAAVTIVHDGRPALGDALLRTDDDLLVLDPVLSPACLYRDCDPETVAWAMARVGPQRLETLRQPPRNIAWRQRPSTYAVCAQDMTVHPDLQRIMAARCTDSVEWPTGHSPFLVRPELVADLVVREARRMA
jgi:pimeloyl-ACP methyl ester carboxylesterase